MLPADLKSEQFKAYPPEARQVATDRLPLLRELPLAFVPLLLRELVNYDWKFPAERKELDRQFIYLSGLSPEQLQAEVAPFRSLRLSSALERLDWVNSPATFSEQLSAHLWATHQIDQFRSAAIAYMEHVRAAHATENPVMPRLGIVLIGQGVTDTKYRLFRKLSREGVYFKQVDPAGGLQQILNFVAARAGSHPSAFGHWYIDGGVPMKAGSDSLACVSYRSLDSARAALLNRMKKAMYSDQLGPEALRSMLAGMRPEELGLKDNANSTVLSHFQVSLLTEGSGTQIFSTTFVQWAAREALRRAQPVTLLVRFTPRQHEQGLDEILAGNHKPVLDPEGSLIDADMGAYYTWLNLQRLPGADQSSFLVWFEDHNQAVAVAPSLPRGQVVEKPIKIEQLLSRIT